MSSVAVAGVTLVGWWLAVGAPGWPPGHAWTARWWCLALAGGLGLLPGRARIPALGVLALGAVAWTLRSPLSRLPPGQAAVEVAVAAVAIALLPWWSGSRAHRAVPAGSSLLVAGLLAASGSVMLGLEAAILAGACLLGGPASRATWALPYGLVVLAGLHFSELGWWSLVAIAAPGLGRAWPAPHAERP